MAGVLSDDAERFIRWQIKELLEEKYKSGLRGKEKRGLFIEVFKELRKIVREEWSKSRGVPWQMATFLEVAEKTGPELNEEIRKLIEEEFNKVEKEAKLTEKFKEREKLDLRKKAYPRVIKIKRTPYKCPKLLKKGLSCGKDIFEFVLEDGTSEYYCATMDSRGMYRRVHSFSSTEDILKASEKVGETALSKSISRVGYPVGDEEKGMAEFKKLFEDEEKWWKLSAEERKAYVSKFLKHPLLKNQIKKLRKDKFLWPFRPDYYGEADELTGFKYRRKEFNKEKINMLDELGNKYSGVGVNKKWLSWLQLRTPKYWRERSEKIGELRDKYYKGGGFGPEEEKFLRGGLIGGIDRIAGRHSEHVRGAMPAIVIFGLGAVISIILGSLMFFFAFFSLAFYFLFPPAKEKTDNEGKGTGEWEHTGFAYLKSVLKGTCIILFALGIGQTNLPFANIFLMFVALGGYAWMSITYNSKRSDQLFESFIRFAFLGVLVIPWFIFGQIFGSPLLGIMALLFFGVPPIRVGGGETEAVERTFTYQIWKPIFLVGMLFVLMMSGVLGFNIFGTEGAWAGWGLTGTLSYIFIYVWFVAFLAGLFTSPEGLPAIGAIVLIVTTVLFGLGPGAQNIGIALFGQWWPTVHNTVSEFTKPLGDLFYQLSQTFGQTLFMLTNPMGFAQQISEGTYVENPTGPTGAYGLEIQNLYADSIYVGEPFSVRFELANKGSFDAKNVFVELWSNVNQFNITDETDSAKGSIVLKADTKPERENYIDWYRYKYPGSYETIPKPTFDKPIIKQDIKPLFYLGNITCTGQTNIKKMWGITTAAGATLREKYLSFSTRINYTYEVYSNLQVEIISQQEWDSRVRKGLLIRGQKLSLISTAPAKLSIGAMDQPIREDLPMFIGFNLSSEEGPRSRVGAATVVLELPKVFKEKNPTMTCTEKKHRVEEHVTDDKWVLTWKLDKDESKSVFCFMKAPDVGDVPSKTFTIFASAIYSFERWERKDTLINFRDACERGETEEAGDTETEGQTPSPTAPGGINYCKNEMDQGRYCDIGNGGCYNSNQCDNSKKYAINPNNLGTQYGLTCNTNVNSGKGVCCPGTPGTGSIDKQCQAAFDAWMKGGDAYQAFLDAYNK